jgi:PhnB protein
MAKPIPDGFHTVSPHLIVPDGVLAVEFYKQAFGAQEVTRLMAPDGRTLMHAQLKIGDSAIMLGSEFPPNALSPKNRGGASVFLHIYTADADAAFDRAIKAGCKVNMPMSDMFWGDRYGQLEDPFGHIWSIATHQHDYTPEQVVANAKAFFAKMEKGNCDK